MLWLEETTGLLTVFGGLVLIVWSVTEQTTHRDIRKQHTYS